MKKKWASQIFYTIIEHGAIRILDASLTILLIRFMLAEQFGLFTVYQSWVSFILLFLPSIENILYPEYSTLKNNNELYRDYEVFKRFNFLKVVIALLFVLILAFLPQTIKFQERFALLLLASALPLAQSFYGYVREPLRFELKQHLVTIISSLQRFSLVVLVYLISVYYPANAEFVSFGALAVYVFFGFIWNYFWKKYLNKTKPALLTQKIFIKRVSHVLTGTVLWMHINGIVMSVIQTLDVYWLNFFRFDLSEIGRYGIALKCANFFQMVPLALVNSFGVYLGVNKNDFNVKTKKDIVIKTMFIFLFLNILFLMISFFIANELLMFIGKGKINLSNIDIVRKYFFWQLGGILIFSLSHPLTTYLSAHYSVRDLTKKIYFPWFFSATFIYSYLAYYSVHNRSASALYSAYANVAVYFVLLLLSGVYFRFKTSAFHDL